MKTFTKTKFHQQQSYAAIVKTNAKQLTKLNTELIEIKNKLAYPKKTNLENDEEFKSLPKTFDLNLKELTTSLSKTLNLEKSKTKALAEWLSNLIQILTGTISTVSSISNDP